MSCVAPLLAYRNRLGEMKILNRDKWSIFEAERYFGRENVFFIPCGKCSGCKLSKRKEYAIRAAMEAKYYENNCFITLTYDDEHLPKKLVKDHLQKFIKSVRNKGYQVRYFGCGEYGSTTLRPHYHIILFGYFPKDAKLYSESSTGFSIFRSEEVEKLWSKGFVTVQQFDSACAGYVAGYVNKKLDDDGSFLLMSKRPGLGYRYLYEFRDKFAENGFVCDDFGSIKKAAFPRYFEKIADKLGIDLTYLKQKRLEAVSLATAGEMFLQQGEREKLLAQKKQVYDKKFNKLRRSL